MTEQERNEALREIENILLNVTDGDQDQAIEMLQELISLLKSY